MSEPYIYTDRDGDKLTIARSDAWPDHVFIRPTSDGAYIAAADLPKIVAQLYKAAGQPAPIILPRYEPDAMMTRGRKVRPTLTPTGDDMTIAEARDLASWYATAADLADAEPDPEQIKALADVIEASGTIFRHDAELAAKAALRAGFTRSES